MNAPPATPPPPDVAPAPEAAAFVPAVTDRSAPDPGIPPEHRTLGMLCHLLVFVGFVFPFGSLLAPLILWLVKRREVPFVAEQGAAVLNFEITVLLAYLALLPASVLAFAAALLLGPVGILLAILLGVVAFVWTMAVFLYWLVMSILGAVAASNGQHFRYPVSLRLIGG